MFHFLQSNRCRLAHMGPKELVHHHEEAEVVCCVGQLHSSCVESGRGWRRVREEGMRGTYLFLISGELKFPSASLVSIDGPGFLFPWYQHCINIVWKTLLHNTRNLWAGRKVTRRIFLSVGDGRVLYHQWQREDYPYACHAQEKLCELTCKSRYLSACSVAGA